MKVAITDANIFIDIIFLNFTEHLFAIGLEIHTTHSVINELNQSQKQALDSYIASGHITVIHFSSEQIQELSDFDLPKGLSTQDRSVLFIALNDQSMVLSGDIKLRKCCHSLGLDVHGILWLFDQFISNDKINHSHAIDQMNSLMNFNKWLPMEECSKRIKTWSNF